MLEERAPLDAPPPQARPLLEGSGGVEPGRGITGPVLGLWGVHCFSSKEAQGISFTFSFLWKDKRRTESFQSLTHLLVSAPRGLSFLAVGPLSGSCPPTRPPTPGALCVPFLEDFCQMPQPLAIRV